MVSKQEIEEAIKGKDDFVKINYLNRFLKKADSLDMKKFIHLNLAAINESKGLFYDAVKNVSSAGDISVTFREKRELYMKEVELWIKAGEFIFAEKAFNKAMGYGSENERVQMQIQYEDLFRAIGKSYEDQGKVRKAIEVYKRLFENTKNTSRKNEIKEKLSELYEKTGRILESDRVKNLKI
ncbi:MAG: hypothetical protein QW727_02780 [Candidatus Pacearchaeota archaeon]